jgi:hypothetical protein
MMNTRRQFFKNLFALNAGATVIPAVVAGVSEQRAFGGARGGGKLWFRNQVPLGSVRLRFVATRFDPVACAALLERIKGNRYLVSAGASGSIANRFEAYLLERNRHDPPPAPACSYDLSEIETFPVWLATSTHGGRIWKFTRE